MNLHENFVLVAPRPVRIATPTAPVHFSPFHSAIHRPQARTASVRLISTAADAPDPVKLGEGIPEDENKPTEPFESVSPRASPRPTPPSEALEEFLSILNPSAFLFPPTSPVLRSNNNASHTFFSYRQSTSCISPSEGLGLAFVEHAADDRKEYDNVTYPFKLLGSGPLASPVSRSHTRNPFQRHPSYENASGMLHPDSSRSSTPSPMMALSPAAVPLPLPTADELEPDFRS